MEQIHSDSFGDGKTESRFDNISTVVRTDGNNVLTQVVEVSSGDKYGVCVTSDKKVYTWGTNENMQLGFDNDITSSGVQESWIAKLKEDITDAHRVTAGYKHTSVYKDTGEVYTFGLGSSGQLGNGENFDYYTPQLVRKRHYSNKYKSYSNREEYKL